MQMPGGMAPSPYRPCVGAVKSDTMTVAFLQDRLAPSVSIIVTVPCTLSICHHNQGRRVKYWMEVCGVAYRRNTLGAVSDHDA